MNIKKDLGLVTKGLLGMMTGAMMLTMVACSGGTAQEEAPQGGEIQEDAAQEEIGTAVELLSRVWNLYEEEERFPTAGGDYDNSVMDEPGAVDISNKEMLEMMLYVPQDEAERIDDAALLMHMMNVNTFTAGAFHVKDEANLEDFAGMLEEQIMGTQWMCGFPDKLVMAGVGDGYLVSAFGNEELIDTFKEKLLSEFQSARVLYEEVITE